MDIIEFARLGGKARQASMTSIERSKHARHAVNKRWHNQEKMLASAQGCKKCNKNKFLHPKYTGHEFEGVDLQGER
jgi:hypothetical protein